MNKEIPQFALLCVKTDCPHHLFKGGRYKVDPADKNSDREVATYWLHPIELEWHLIGYFALNCFDTAPIKKWINQKKGISEEPVRIRQRMETKQPQRVKVETRQRQEDKRCRN